jgi:hypothetical protein
MTNQMHELKIQEVFYDAVLSGKKTFEIRINDRSYQAGDEVILRCVNDIGMDKIGMDKIYAEIGYVSHYQQKENWCVFSLNNIEVKP